MSLENACLCVHKYRLTYVVFVLSSYYKFFLPGIIEGRRMMDGNGSISATNSTINSLISCTRGIKFAINMYPELLIYCGLECSHNSVLSLMKDCNPLVKPYMSFKYAFLFVARKRLLDIPRNPNILNNYRKENYTEGQSCD